MLFPMLTAECFSTEYHNSRWNIIILFRKYLVDIKSEVWQNLFWEYVNGKSFAVRKRKISIPTELLADLAEGTLGSTAGSSGD